MKFLLSTILTTLVTLGTSAAVPPVEQLLPSETLGLVTIPDWDKANTFLKESPQTAIWSDAAMKPFRENFLKKLNEDFLTPLEKQLGLKFSDYSSLLHGQITFAAISSPASAGPDKGPGFVLLIDTKAESEQLAKRLAELKTKWTDAGKTLKTEKIRDVEFNTIVIESQEIQRMLAKAFPSEEAEEADGEKAAPSKTELTIGQSNSLLMVGTRPQDLEKILVRMSGGSIPPLAELNTYAANHGAMFRDALGFAWINFKPIFANISKAIASRGSEESDDENPLAMDWAKVIAASGLGNLQTLAANFQGNTDGSWIQLNISVPESERTGLFKILSAERKDASPPAFVPADVLKFSRWRLDGQKTWAGIENLLAGISPQMAGTLQAVMGMIGKDKDPNFDLKKSLIGNLGDDIVSYEKKPRSNSLADMASPPSLTLIGSPNPEQLLNAIKSATGILPLAMPDAIVTEREFLGQKIYSQPLPALPTGGNEKPVQQFLHFSSSKGYVAFSKDAATLEEFLRTGEGSGKSLRELSALTEAAQKAGGMSTGFFAYDNQKETTRTAFEMLKNNPELLANIKAVANTGADAAAVVQWFDPSLLPPFDSIAKYFSFTIYTGDVSNQGFSWKFYSPVPPELKK